MKKVLAQFNGFCSRCKGPISADRDRIRKSGNGWAHTAKSRCYRRKIRRRVNQTKKSWFGDPSSVSKYRAAKDSLASYYTDSGDDPEYLRRNRAVIDAEKSVPWWRR